MGTAPIFVSTKMGLSPLAINYAEMCLFSGLPFITRLGFMAQDDNVRRWSMYALIGFGATGILCEIIFALMRRGILWKWPSDFFIILILAGIVGGGVYWTAKKLNL
jgi:hypothetical protein